MCVKYKLKQIVPFIHFDLESSMPECRATLVGRRDHRVSERLAREEAHRDPGVKVCWSRQ